MSRPSILAHGSMPWESRTMMVVAVQGAPYLKYLVCEQVGAAGVTGDSVRRQRPSVLNRLGLVYPSLVLALIPTLSIALHFSPSTTVHRRCLWIGSLMPRREGPGQERGGRSVGGCSHSLSATRAFPRYQVGLRDDSENGKDGRGSLSRR